jgi:hypothetical protein
MKLADYFIPGITRYFSGSRIKIDNGPIFVDYGKTYGEVLYDSIVYFLIFHVISPDPSCLSYFQIRLLPLYRRSTVQ